MNCSKCAGCGQVANTDEQEPWSAWLDLPVKNAMAVFIGLVRPIICSACNGSGKTIVPQRYPKDPAK